MKSKKNLGFLLKDVSRRYTARFEEHAQQTMGLTLTQCRALVQLESNEGVSQARLAELSEVDAMTMVRILDRMEVDQLLERRPDPADRRARSLFLTEKAAPLLDEIYRIADITRDEITAAIPKNELAIFMRVLQQMHVNASDFNALIPK